MHRYVYSKLVLEQVGRTNMAKPPFADILWPLCDGALADFQRATTLADISGEVRRAVSDGLRCALEIQLSAEAARTLFSVFVQRRPPPPLIAVLLDEPTASTPRDIYSAFANEMAAGGLDELRQSHPGLDRSLTHSVAHGLAAAVELATRLQDDACALSDFVPGWQAGVPPPMAVEMGLSDPHALGRMVAGVVFADGTKLAYKPRPLVAEAGFGHVMDWLVRLNPALPGQRLPRVLDCVTHGWMEWIEPSECKDAAEVGDYYRRLGMLAATLGLLRGTDIHSENLIAAGAFPVVVDLECLLSPDLLPDWMKRLADQPPFMESGLLPFLVPLGENRWRNIGSGGPPLPPAPLHDFGFRHAGTDWMDRATVPYLPREAGLPRLAGERQDIREHLPELCEGYRSTLEIGLAHRDALLAEDGPLAVVARARCRFVALPTDTYRRLINRQREPDMTAAVDARERMSAYVERASIPGIAAADWCKLIAAEVEALGRGDIPAFVFLASDGVLFESAGTEIGRPEVQSPQTPLAAAGQAIRALDGHSATRHAAILKKAFAPLRLSEPSNCMHGSVGNSLVDALGDWLARSAIERCDGGVDWLRPHEALPVSMRLVGPGMYHGAAGIALALAVAGHHRCRQDWLDLAQRALLPLHRLARESTAGALLQALRPGYAVGLGGMIAALAWAGDLLQDDSAHDDALRLAQQLGDPAEVCTFDLYEGISGLLIALHLLWRLHRSSTLPPLMALWADRLLALSKEEGKVLLWYPRHGKPLAGLAHGQSGMAVALGCAFDATGELHYLTAAQRALWAEDKLFDGSRPATTWCNGAPGIALARMSLMQIAPETFADRQFELQQALYTTAVAPVGPAGDLCCGLAGRLSVLRLAGWTTAALATEEERRSAGMRPGLWTDELPYPAPDPCLFKGVAGILMAQIQAQAPSGVPPVLLPSLDWSRQPPDDTRNP